MIYSSSSSSFYQFLIKNTKLLDDIHSFIHQLLKIYFERHKEMQKLKSKVHQEIDKSCYYTR
jgi:hypothetical protein